MALSTIQNNSLADTAVHGYRNLIINGAMQVAQWSTSASVSNNTNEGYQTIDRWRIDFGNNASGACTISQDTTVPSNQGFSFSYKVDITTANASPGTTEQIYFASRLEAQDIRNSGWDYTKSDGSAYITCSFWVMSDKAGVYCFYARDHDANGGTMFFVKEFTLVASTWQKVEIQIPSSSSLVFDNDTGAGLEVGFSLLAGSDRNNAINNTWNTADTSRATANQVNFFDSTSNNFYLTGVQLEVGSEATPFEHRSFGDELARCQRYYQVLDGYAFTGACRLSNTAYMAAGLRVIMRDAPAATSTGNAMVINSNATYTQSVAGWSTAYLSDNNSSVRAYWTNFSGMTAGNGASGAQTLPVMNLDAEL